MFSGKETLVFLLSSPLSCVVDLPIEEFESIVCPRPAAACACRIEVKVECICGKRFSLTVHGTNTLKLRRRDVADEKDLGKIFRIRHSLLFCVLYWHGMHGREKKRKIFSLSKVGDKI